MSEGEDHRKRLRNDAERELGPDTGPEGTGIELRRVIRELQVHQLELRTQHEELQRAQVDLECSRAEFQELFDEAPVGYLTCSPAGRIMHANQALATMLDTTVAALLSTALPRFATVEAHDAFHLHMLEVDSAGSASRDMQLETTSGTRLDVRLHSRARRDDADVMTDMLVSVVDQTAVKLAYATLAEERTRAEREHARLSQLEAIGLLAGGIAHDFNNLLTRVMCSVALARSTPETSDDMLMEAEDGLRAAAALTGQLLTFAKGGAPVKQPIVVAELIESTVQFSLRGSNVRSEMELANDLWIVDGDAAQLAQVIQNLVINADEAMASGGVVRIVASNLTVGESERAELTAGPYVHIVVQDRGPGIAEADVPRIFDPYFTTKASGSGLGLATAFSVVRRHGGHIHVVSESGVGTRMHVYLPALPDAEVHQPKEPQSRPVTSSARILVMDDDENIGRLLERALTRSGHRVDIVRDGAAAIAAYRRGQADDDGYDAVFIDLTIVGGMGGVEAIAELKRVDPAVCAIVMSGYSVDPVIADPVSYGFRAKLPKPFNPTILAATLAAVLGQRSPVA